MSELSIVIPFYKNGSKWDCRELVYALRSLDKNLKFKFDVTIYSDEPLPFLKNVRVVEVPRFYPQRALKTFDGTKHYENYYDTLNKIRTASYDDELSENILYAYDDILLLQKQDIEQITTVYGGGTYRHRQFYWDNPKRKWTRTISETIKHSKAYGEVYLYETHLPRYFNRKKLQDMFKKYPIDNMDIPYSPSTLYYNMYYNKPDVMYRDENNPEQMDNPIKAGFYGQDFSLCDCFPSKTVDQIKKHTEGKIWVNYADNGLTPAMQEWIKKTFPKKCKFES